MAGPAATAAGAPVTSAGTGTEVTVRSAQAVTGLVDVSLDQEARAALRRGLDWLADRQRADGSWSDTNFPALTALPLWAFALSDHPAKAAAISNAVRFVLTCVQADGGIYRNLPGKGGGLGNYNTALCMVALHASGVPALTPVVQQARKYMAANQHLEGDDIYRGGMGYDRTSGRMYTDLSDSVIGYEAMRLTQGVEDLRPAGEKRVDLDWVAATQFLDRVQNKAAAGPEDAGGFIYRPDESKAGAVTNREGTVTLRSYASMTYAGLLSLIYADVSKKDPRVQAALGWAVRHWSLEDNPGMGVQGLYYFYNIMTKALAAYGLDRLPRANAAPIDWRSELVRKLVSLQRADKDDSSRGYWVNENNRFWEQNPELVTSYSILALEIALGK
jgi:squalene-hopene/tetraprenyl-beta-curcumene cyclase